MSKKMIIILSVITIIVIAAVGFAGFASSTPDEPVVQKPQTIPVTKCDVEQSIAAPGRVINTQVVSIEMPVDGKLEDVFVKEGSLINVGEPLAKLANPSSLIGLRAKAELDALQAQVNLNSLYNNAEAKEALLNTDLIDAQEALEKAEAKRLGLNYSRASSLTIEGAISDVNQAQEAYDMAMKIYKSRSGYPITHPNRVAGINALIQAKQRLDNASANLNWLQGKANTSDIAKADLGVAIARANVFETQAALDRLQNGIDPIEEAQAEVNLAEAQARLVEIQQVQESGVIIAPISGVVLSVNIKPGDTLFKGTSILSLSDPKSLEVKANITEEDYPLLAPGMDVELFFDAIPEAIVRGKVDRIVPKRIEGDRPLYNIYISLEEVPTGLVDGMTADAAITIANRDDVLCLPRSVVRASGTDSTVVKVWNGLTTESHDVELGLRGDTTIEIVSGLKEGDQVVTK